MFSVQSPIRAAAFPLIITESDPETTGPAGLSHDSPSVSDVTNAALSPFVITLLLPEVIVPVYSEH